MHMFIPELNDFSLHILHIAEELFGKYAVVADQFIERNQAKLVFYKTKRGFWKILNQRRMLFHIVKK